MQGNAEAAVPLLTICGRVKGRPALSEQGGRIRRYAQAGQHDEADSEPRTLVRGSAASQSAGLLVTFGHKSNIRSIKTFWYF